MKAEDQILFTCARQVFCAKHRQTISQIVEGQAINWGLVYHTALAHGVAPLVYTNLRRCAELDLNIPDTVMDNFQHCFFSNMSVKAHRARNLHKIVAYFRNQSIDILFIKGVALDLLVYEHPYYTMSKDDDIILRLKRSDISKEARLQIMKDLHGLGIEYDYFEHHDVAMNGVLPINFQRVWQAAKPIDFQGQTVWVMSPEDTLLSICINSCRKRFFRLKSLCDLSEVMRSYPELDWQKFVAQARAYECHNIVYTALFTTHLLLGCELPGPLTDLRVSPLRRRTIHLLIRYLNHHLSLSTVYPFNRPGRLIGTLSLSLLLSYATFGWGQIRRKINVIYRLWQLERKGGVVV